MVSTRPVDIVRKLLDNATDPAAITDLVAEDATYISLNSDDEELRRMMPWTGTKYRPEVF